MQKIMNQELNVVVMPTGYLQLEWTDAQNDISKSGRVLQKEIYRRFFADTDFIGYSFPPLLNTGGILQGLLPKD